MVKLFIGGIAPQADEMGLAELVGPYGDIVTVKIVRDKATRKSKGFAFIEMASREAAELAVDALDGQFINGKELTVNIQEDEPVKTPPVYRKVERPGDTIKKKRPRLNRP